MIIRIAGFLISVTYYYATSTSRLIFLSIKDIAKVYISYLFRSTMLRLIKRRRVLIQLTKI